MKRIIIENVWEFIGWGPVDPRSGKPIKSRKGEYFHAWIDTIRRLGFDPEWRKLNAADYGDATTRQRFILMARSDRKPVSWPMPTHARKTDGLALFPGVKPWRPAREIIDWSIKGRSIFDRKKPLAPKTLARIYAGAQKFGWPEPFLVILRNHMAGQNLDQPLPTIAANGTHIALAQPVIVNMKGQSTASAVEAPIPTQTSHAGHIYVAEPFVMAPGSTGAPRETAEPLPTITTGGAGVDERPGCARPMLIEPFIATVAHGNNSGEARADDRRIKSIDDSLGTLHAGSNKYAVIEPFVLSQASGGAPRSVREPIPTATTGGNGASHALISPYYGSGSGETCGSAENPLPTVTSKARFGMVVPVTHTQRSNSARDVSDPLPTMTTAKGGEFAMVMPVTHAGGSDRARDAAEPLPTITGANRGEIAFIQAIPQFDILFRMLEPHELAAAMGFNSEDQEYEFAGTKTEKIKQIGNAVSVAKIKACVSTIMADAAAKPTAEPVAPRTARA